MRKRLAIIGAGISGLSIAHLLKERYEITVYESESRPGGMVKCDRINGNLFHRTGGHVFNTKMTDAMDFFWSFFDKEKDFLKADRHSCVCMDNHLFVPYPIENHLYFFEDNIIQSVINDLIEIKKNKKDCHDDNFEDFLINRFGKTLYEMYFRPYNEKIWRRSLTNVPLSWLEGKLPMPDVEEILFNNIKKIEEKKFVHSTFYYAKQNGSQFIADKMAESLNILYNNSVTKINGSTNGKWIINNSEYDMIIYCGNIKHLPSMIDSFEEEDKIIINNLESHGTTTVLCEIDKNPYSWIYQPSSEHKSHRIICTGNFSSTNNRTQKNLSASIEFTDYMKKEDILENLKKIPYHPNYITHHYEKYTYPIQNMETRNNIQMIKKKLEKQGIYLCGRFAEWEYYNMDACMASAIKLSKTIDI